MQPEQQTPHRERMLGVFRVVASGLIWGTIPLVIRYSDGASIVKVFFRVFFAALAVGAWMALTGGWRELQRLRRETWAQLAIQGLILTLNWVLFLTALDLTSVATAELLAYTSPVFVAALAPFVTREPFDRRVVAPLLVALAGIVIILAPQGLSLSSRSEFLGAGLAFASALTYAALLLRSKKLLRSASNGALMLVEYTLASLVLLPFVAAAYARGDAPSTPGAYAALVTLGIVHTALAGFIFLGGVRRVRTDHVAVLTYIEPVSAVGFAALFLGEPVSAATLIGGALVVGSGVRIARMEAREGVETLPIEMPSAPEDDRDGPRTGISAQGTQEEGESR